MPIDKKYYVACNIGFSSKWLACNVNWDYQQETINDPMKRIEMVKSFYEYFNANFSEIYPEIPRKLTINIGEIGVHTMPKLFGCKIKYSKEVEPWALPIIPNKINPMKLRIPNIEEGLRYLTIEYEKIREQYGRKIKVIAPDLQGPLNIAYRLCGKSIFYYIRIPSKKEIGHHIMKVITDTYIEVHKWIRKLLGERIRKAFVISECTSLYVSPHTFKEFNLKYDTMAAEELGPILVHSCGETTNEKLELFTQIPNFIGAELGFGTDLKHARKLFIGDHSNPLLIIARIDPLDMLKNNPNEIERKVKDILSRAQGGPLMLSVLEVPYGTPKENIIAYYTSCSELNETPTILNIGLDI
ncbi:MAG: hypothetical protein BAJALOKI1v1_50004 [Promethearchaeota archaeon]|nr:MAG: hypothetical protein BAJALOKI1v1_50004 [Candidatus Lokiarchaeota archaeon]